jgi:hypothetical protein
MKIQSNGNGIKSFESEFDEDTECPTSPGDGASEHKQSEKSDDSSKGLKHSADEDFSNATPLAHQIFAPDAEVVLPQALTASQLFGIERVTGIELEAAAGIAGLSHLFLRWLGELDCFILYQYINPRNIFLMTVKYRVIIL